MSSRLVRVVAGALLVAGSAEGILWASVEPRTRLAMIAIGIGVVGVTLLAVRSLGARGEVRLRWAGIAVACLFWDTSIVGAVEGWPGWLVWGVFRTLAFVAVMLGLLSAPEVWRSGRDWGLVLVDGWIMGATGLGGFWLLAGPVGTAPWDLLATIRPPLVWACLELPILTVVAGLSVRAAPRARPSVSLIAAGVMAAVAGDAVWGTTGDAVLGVGLWLLMVALLGWGVLLSEPHLWAGAARDPDRLQVTRLPQLAAVPGLLAAVIGPADPVIDALALSLLPALAADLMIRGNQMRALWDASREQARRFDAVLSGSMEAIMQLDAHGVIQYANPAAALVFGYPVEELTGQRLTDLSHPDDLARARALIPEWSESGDVLRMIARFRQADGSWRHLGSTLSALGSGDRAGGDGYVVIARDVDDRIHFEAELRRQATIDTLTGLLNRKAFLAALANQVADGRTAVLYLDLDGFKGVNDTQGHEAGDRILVQAALSIVAAAGPRRPAGRLGGDEFSVFVPLEPDEGIEEVEALARKLVEELARPEEDGGVSIGVAVSAAADPGGADELLGDADLAMYEAKGAGGGRAVMFRPEMRRKVLERARMRDDLERAVRDGGLSLDLQPIVELETGRWVGFEGLVRWVDGGRRRPPAEFVPLAEETGLIVPLGTWVLHEALGWLTTWPDPAAGISVNVTERQVTEPGFVDRVRAELEATGVEPSRLTLEITEQTAVEDVGREGTVLEPLRALGVHLALDDFGTGFSSLGHLARLPVDTLKIDSRFVAGLGRRSEDDALVRAVLSLAADFGLTVVAEGVETPEQAAALGRYGCHLVQGFLFARPVPARSISRPEAGTTGTTGTDPENGTGAIPRQSGPDRRPVVRD